MQQTFNDWLDQVAFCSAGDAFDDANPPGVFQVDPYTGDSTILVNNFFGIRFNGFDDIHALSDGYGILNASQNPVLMRVTSCS